VREVHPSLIIDGGDVTVDYSTNGLLWYPIDSIASYDFALTCATKEHVPVPNIYPETTKISKKVALNLACIVDKNFELPDPCWLKVGLFLVEISNGDKWYWSRSGLFTRLNKQEVLRPDDKVDLQYQFSSNGELTSGLELRPAIIYTYFGASYTSAVQLPTMFGSSQFLYIL
jgi:hypothetical protein